MNNAREICNNFLRDLDIFIANNLNSLTCADIYNIYSNFYQDLKQFKGNSSGFTGLSEYLIFRIFYHLLGGNFKPTQITHDLYDFRSINNKIRIGQNIPIIAGSKRYYPDVLIFKEDFPLMVVEIKLYLTYGMKTLENDIQKLAEINKEYPGTKGLFISYNTIPIKGKIYRKLLDEERSKDWLNYLILHDNNQSIKKILEKIIFE
jgi:hypothetical protein